ncbi:MAG: sensor domain-containing protein [Bacillota bacterium]
MSPVIRSEDVDYSEAFYYTLFEQHHLPVLIIRPVDGQIIDVNETAVQFYGYDKLTLKTMTIFDINTLSKEAIKQKMAEAKQKNERHFHFQHRLSSGDIRDVKINSIPVTYKEETLLFSLVTDMTDAIENNAFFHTLFEESPYAIMLMNRDYEIEKVNHHFEQLFGYSNEEAIGHTPEQLIYPANHKAMFQSNKRMMEEGIVISQNSGRQAKNGEVIDIQMVAMPVYIDNFLVAACAIYIDKRQEQEMKSYNQMLASVLENTNQGVVITNTKGEIEWINQAYTTITGYGEDDVKGNNPRLLQSGKHGEGFYEKMWHDILKYGSWTGEIWNRRKNGDVFPEFLKIFSIKNEQGEIVHFVGIFIDNTEAIAHEKQIDVLETKDTLTGLYNRSYITQYLDGLLDDVDKGTVTLLYMDIDRFKAINDNLGHTVGDQLLIAFTTHLKHSFPSAVLARVSGDEFVVVLAEQERAKCGALLQHLFDQLKFPVDLGHHQLLVTCSVGVATYPRDAVTANELLMHADIAMFEAKKQEGNSMTFYDVALTVEMNRAFDVKTALQQADFDRDFTLHYQPVIDVQSGQVVGAEALLRFSHTTLGHVSPSEFIPIAENNGLILPIGEWVLRRACRDIGPVIDMTAGRFKIAVNVSIQQLESQTFPLALKAILEETNFPANQLVLEVTEETSVSHSERVKETINKIEAYGVSISIDDFGTGYSSLEKLHRLKVNQLKIDQSFIRDLEETTAIVRAILAMGESLELSVVAEGVETKDQLDFLKTTTCDYVQGYYFSRPLAFKDFQAYLLNKKRSS